MRFIGIVVTTIGMNAFLYNDLNSVNIPSSVMSIGLNAFYCVNLTSFTLPEHPGYQTVNAWKDVDNNVYYDGNTVINRMPADRYPVLEFGGAPNVYSIALPCYYGCYKEVVYEN